MIIIFVTVLVFPLLSLISEDQQNSDMCTLSEQGVSMDAAGKSIYSWGLVRGKNGDLPQVASPDKTLLYKYSGVYIGDIDSKNIYITFDEGYENGYTNEILDVLKSKNVKAVFFITGDYLERSSELVRRMLEEGHEVGNHSMNHYSFATISGEKVEEEIRLLDEMLFEKFGRKTYFVRPPKGEFNETALSVIEAMGKKCMMWSFAYKDWIAEGGGGKKWAYDNIVNNFHNGEIILLHAVSPDNAAALSDVIDEARRLGYEFGDPGEFKS